ncbi:MAG: hypothetical protein ACK5IC_09975 [Moheibacter sp.]
MAKNINIDEVLELLASTKKVDLKKGINLATKNQIELTNDFLYQILSNSINDEKFWESNVQIIDYFGITQYEKSEKILDSVCIKNEPHSMVTMSSAQALCRIKKTSDSDILEVNRLLSFGNFSVVNGVLKFLGQDEIIPNSELEMKKIIDKVNNFEPKYEKGYSDVRVGLALACSLWPKLDFVKDFLNNCLLSSYNPLVRVATNSLKDKRTNIG